MPHYKDLDNNLHWLDDASFEHYLPSGSVQLTEEEEEQLQTNIYVQSYKDLRASEYPDFRDYLDGVVKGDQAQIQEYIDACLAVKAKYPKG